MGHAPEGVRTIPRLVRADVLRAPLTAWNPTADQTTPPPPTNGPHGLKEED